MEDLTGQKFGRWTVIKFEGRSKNRHPMWKCICVCGKEKIIGHYFLLYKQSQSCGCLNKEITSKRSIRNDSGKKVLYRRYESSAKRRGLDFLLNMPLFEFLTKGHCFYCGEKPKQLVKKVSIEGHYIYNGIDRVDNSRGYTPENCIPCCEKCNFLKSSRKYDDFISHIIKIANHMNLQKLKKYPQLNKS